MPLDSQTLQTRVHEILLDALQLEPDELPVDRPFLEVAISSLALVDAFRRISDELGVRPSLRRIFDRHGTVAALVPYLQELQAQAEAEGPAVGAARVYRDPEAGSVRVGLTRAQQHLRFISELRADASAASTHAVVVQLEGGADPAVMQRALQALVDRHEGLRAAVDLGGEALVVHQVARVELVVRDASRLPADRRNAQVAQWVTDAATVPVHLHQGFSHATLVLVGPQLALLVMTAHSLVADVATLTGWVEELAQLYTAEGRGAPAGLAAPLSLVAENAAELEREQSRDWAACGDWWAQQLAGELPQTDLPGDLPRPAVKSYRGGRVVLPLDGALRQSISDGTAMGSYLHLLAVLEVLVARVAGQTDLVVGVEAVALGERRQTGGAHGARVLPLRSRYEATRSFADHQRDLRERYLDLLDNQALPFAGIVARVDPPRDQSRSQLFTVSLERRVYPALSPFGPAAASWVTAPRRHTPVDLQISLVELPDRAQLQCDFSTDLYEVATVRHLLALYRRLLVAAAAEPMRAVGTLPWMDSAEQASALDQAKGPARPVDGAATVIGQVLEAARRHPARVALVDGARELRYDVLVDGAGRVAAALEAAGVGRGDRVGLCAQRSAEAVIGMLGALLVGAAYVPLDPAYPADRLTFMAQDAGLKAILTDAVGVQSTSALALPRVPLLPALEGLPPVGRVVSSAQAEDLAYVMYTSGSTGRPKGVMVTHRNVVNLVAWGHETFGRAAFDGMLLSTSFNFDLSVFEIFATLGAGGACILAPHALALPTLPAAERVTFVNTVPSAISELTLASPLPAAVRVVLLCGEPLRRAVAQRIYENRQVESVWNVYGPTEATVYATAARVAREGEREPDIGQPIANYLAWVVDPAGQVCPPAVPGELWLGGEGIAQGYHARPDLNEQAFVSAPPGATGRAYRTGDLVRRRLDGALEFIGRRDQQVKVRGYRVELGEIEAALRAHEAVTDAVVVARRNREGDLRLFAYVVVHAQSIHRPDLRAYLGERLPRQMVPSHIVELSALPRLPNGKIDRAALPEPDASRESRVQTTFRPPASSLERSLAGIWCDLLELEQVGLDDNFFDLGGDSLLITPLLVEVASRLGVRVTLAEFFEHATIGSLVRLVERLHQQRLATAGRRVVHRVGPDVDALFAERFDDARLHPSLQLADGAALPGDPTHMFVTGVTGFVGAYTFKELLDRSDARFTCMVRCSDPAQGHARVVAKLKKEGLWEERYADRFVAVNGDLGQERLGMDPATWAEVTDRCDAVLHSAALVNFIYPYRALRPINVGGLHEMLRLAFSGRPKRFHHVSTAAVWPMGHQYTFGEEDSIYQKIRLNLGYDESKWVAEHLVREAGRRGLPVSIYRPGEVSGHSQSGACVLDHFLFAILKGSLQMCAAPDVLGTVDIAPVDYTAAAIAHLSLQASSSGRSFHLNNPRPCMPRDWMEWTRAYGYTFDLLPFDRWVDRLMARPDLSQNALYPFMAIVEEFEESNLQFPVYQTDQTQGVLEAAGIFCPPVDARLMYRYYDYFRAVNFLAHPDVYRSTRG